MNLSGIIEQILAVRSKTTQTNWVCPQLGILELPFEDAIQVGVSHGHEVRYEDLMLSGLCHDHIKSLCAALSEADEIISHATNYLGKVSCDVSCDTSVGYHDPDCGIATMSRDWKRKWFCEGTP